MKKAFGCIALTVFMLLSLFLCFPPSAKATGEHQTEVPEGWVGIYTMEDLQNYLNADRSGKYIQMAELELGVDDTWTPIGTFDQHFCGTFDGNGYSIWYLELESTELYQGLFGYVEGTIQNVTMEELAVTGGKYTGGIAGYLSGGICINCTVNGTVIGSDDTGGIVGYAGSGTIENCRSNAVVKGNQYTGGIAGGAYASVITACVSSMTVRGKECTGGIVGYDSEYAVSNLGASSVNRCRNDATVIGTDYCGGIAGKAVSTRLADCFNTGTVNGSSRCGGITGGMTDSRSCIDRCYNVGTATDSSSSDCRIMGDSVGKVNDCFYLATEAAEGYGLAVSEDQLRMRGCYVNWDFDEVWTMAGSADYAFAELRCLSPDEFTIPAPETDSEGRILVWTKYDLYNTMADPEASYIQMADIDFTAADFSEEGDFFNLGMGWRPIGAATAPFTGTYDGNGYTIRGLKITSSKSDQGLFGYVRGAVLQNVTLRDSVISGTGNVGGIAGTALNSTITKCHSVSNIVTGTGENVGGLIGLAFSVTVNNCYVSGSVSGGDCVGGITGSLTGHYYDSIRSKSFFGSNTMQQCKNCADVSGSSQVGGISGNALRATLTETSGPISITDCYNMGDISGTSFCGGILGRGIYKTSTSTSNSMSGISLGYCFSVGQISSSDLHGGIIGMGYYSVSYCYYLNTSVDESANDTGTALSAEQLQVPASYAWWDFDTIWTMIGDEDYAELRCFTISGSAIIAGDPVYNGTVSANVSRIKQLRGYTVAWYADGTLLGNEDPFSVPAAAVGKKLTLVVTSTDDIYRGSLTSRAVTVGKAACIAEALPSEELSKSSSTFTISTEDGQEYSLDRQSWQTSGGFSNLEPGTAYTVYTRVAETELYLAGEIIEAITVTTERQPIAGQIRITGTPEYTRTLGVDTSLLTPSGATYDLEWRCGETVLGTGETYVLTAEDIGQSITVAAIGTGKYIGTVESAAVTAEPCDIAIVTADLAASYTYTHDAITPMVALKNGKLNLRKGTDYTVEYLNNTNAGNAVIRVSGIGNYKGTKDVGFTIAPMPVEQLTVAAIPDEYYTGSAIEPELTILHGSYRLVKDQDYTVAGTDNLSPGTATVTVTGINNYSGSLERSFTILRQPLNAATVTTAQEEYAYTESEITPEVTVVFDGRTLSPETDYTVSYTNNLREGTATVTVTGVNGYSGAASTTFRITGHLYGEWQTRVEPSCTEEGLRFKVCSGCDAGADGHEITEVIPALGHDLVHHDAQDPTCTEPGWEEYDTCSRCDYSTCVEIPALGHDWGEWTLTTEPTETSAGEETRTCRNDPDHTETRTVWAIVLRTDAHGSVSASAPYALPGTEITVNAEPAEGWLFDGWTVLTEGLTVSDGAFTMPEAPVILEARWIAETHTITFVTGVDGLEAEPITAAVGEHIDAPSVVREGWRLLGWFRDQALTVEFLFTDSTVMPPEDLTLYAKWEQYTVLIQSVTVDGEADPTVLPDRDFTVEAVLLIDRNAMAGTQIHVLVAAYDEDGRFLGVSFAELTDTESGAICRANIANGGEVAFVKVFVLDDRWVPMTGSRTIGKA